MPVFGLLSRTLISTSWIIPVYVTRLDSSFGFDPLPGLTFMSLLLPSNKHPQMDSNAASASLLQISIFAVLFGEASTAETCRQYLISIALALLYHLNYTVWFICMEPQKGQWQWEKNMI